MTYYDILEVSTNASSEVIKNAYKALAKKHHPDNFENEVDKQTAEEKIKEIVEAYEILGDEEKKKAYDKDSFSSGINSESSATETPKESMKYERPSFNQRWLRWVIALLILSIIGSGSYIFFQHQQEHVVALAERKAEKPQLEPISPPTDEEVKSIVGEWTFQKKRSFAFLNGNNYEVLLGTSRDYTHGNNISPTYQGKIFLLHYDQAKKTWLNVWYYPIPIIAYTSPEYVFPSLNIIQKTDTALVAVQTYYGGNGGITDLTYFTISDTGAVSIQKDMNLGSASMKSVETKDDKIIATGSGGIGIHELTLINGQVNDKVTPRSEMGDQEIGSIKVYFLLNKDGKIIPANSAYIDIMVGDTVVFSPQDDITKIVFDSGNISIHTNAWNDGHVNMSNANELKSGNSYTFKKVGVFDFILANSSDFHDNPIPTFTINVKS